MAMTNLTLDEYFQRRDIVELVLKFVSKKDLSNIAVVSKRLHLLASDPLLWDGVSLSHNKLTKHGLYKYFSDCKFIRFRRLKLSVPLAQEDCTVLLEHLKDEDNKIRELDLKSCNLKHVSPGILAEIVTNVK